MTNERIQLLRNAADDCESEANNLLNQAPNMGPTKERNYRNEAAACLQRAFELRAWATELERDEPRTEPVDPSYPPPPKNPPGPAPDIRRYEPPPDPEIERLHAILRKIRTACNTHLSLQEDWIVRQCDEGLSVNR